MSSKKTTAKRKRKQEEDSTEEESTEKLEYSLFGGWMDDGYEGEDGGTEHEGFSLTLRGKNFDISLGDAVLLRSTTDDEEPMEYRDASTQESSNRSTKAGGKGMIARVERIWENTQKSSSDTCPFMFQARWFLRVSIVHASISRKQHLHISNVNDLNNLSHGMEN